jgi:hypothetical protein
MIRSLSCTAAAAATALTLALTAPVASADVVAGVLTCSTVPGSRINLLIRSTSDVTCEFKDTAGKTERYRGESGIALGLDLSFKSEETFAFSVISANDANAGSHALAGKYGGGRATASVGVGVGAAALIGGNDDNFGLNPLALSAERGVGASAGIGFLYLEADK